MNEKNDQARMGTMGNSVSSRTAAKVTPTSHTPGPWETVGATRVWRTGRDGGAVAIIANPECATSGDFVEVWPTHERWNEAMANARLIAAAPDMLAALKHAENFCPCGARPESPRTHPHSIECPIGDAIAKAESR